MNLINISGNTFYIRGGTNTGLYLFDDNSALIIDPGLSGARPNKIIKILNERNIELKYIINTHEHNDHFGACSQFKEYYKDVEILSSEEAKLYIDKGELVPDEITIKMLEKRMEEADVKNGAILDGFPRTKIQAEALDKLLKSKGSKVDMALNIDVPFDEIVERIANRRSCRGCSAIYNVVFNPSKEEGKCDECGGELYQREDQKPEIVQNRLKIYKHTSEELIKYYEEKKVLRTEKAGEQSGRTSYDVASEVEKDIRGNKIG